MSASCSTEASRATALAVERTTSTSVAVGASLAGLAVLATEAVGGDGAGCTVACAESTLAAGVAVFCLATAPVTGGTAVAKCASLTSLAVEGSASAVGGDLVGVGLAGTKRNLATRIAVSVLSTVALGRTAVTICAALAGLSILAAEPIS
ncbi:hypothetical protein HG530_012400 [Fusarium avenaceum]|nr:hypothetical protein HG530_012400 [Fusarium avenaceum]